MTRRQPKLENLNFNPDLCNSVSISDYGERIDFLTQYDNGEEYNSSSFMLDVKNATAVYEWLKEWLGED